MSGEKNMKTFHPHLASKRTTVFPQSLKSNREVFFSLITSTLTSIKISSRIKEIIQNSISKSAA